MALGVLSRGEMLELAQSTPCRISGPSGDTLRSLAKDSSLDLPLGNEYWEMKGSCRAGRRMKVDPDLIRRHSLPGQPKTLVGESVLKRKHVYLFRSSCSLNLSDSKIQGKATARSSIGRLDVLVRLLCDEAEEFDRVPEGYDGPLYVEVTPISFDLIVRPGTCLSQLRLFRGSDRLVSITQEEFRYEPDFPIVGSDRRFASEDPHEVWYRFRLDLSPDPSARCSGFAARRDAREPIDPDQKANYSPREFWDPVPAKDDAIALDTDRLYILRSKEHLRIPGHMALECQAYTETMGEWRIEYAGFAHPWFGRSREEGSPLIFEVRGHNIPTILTDGIPLGNVCFTRMSQPAPVPDKPEDYGQYEKQELKLSGCFKDWPTQES